MGKLDIIGKGEGCQCKVVVITIRGNQQLHWQKLPYVKIIKDVKRH